MKLATYFFILCLSVWGIRSRESQSAAVQTESSDAVKDWFGITEPLRFGNTSFNLAWSDKPSDTYYVQEYVPNGEKVDHFNQMLTVNMFNREVQTDDAIRQKVNELNERKTTDASCNYAVNRSKDGNEYIIDFILSEGTGAQAIAEYNMYRYKQIEMPGEKRALLVYAYSKRGYGNTVTAFLTNLKTERPSLLQAMSTIQMPVVKISDK